MTARQKKLCSWCGGIECNRQCDEKVKKCVNCSGNHSSLYKGCKAYKEKLWEASTIRLNKEKDKKIIEISKNHTKINTNMEELKNSYANVVKMGNLNEVELKISKTQSEFAIIMNKMESITDITTRNDKDMDCIKNKLNTILTVTQSTQNEKNLTQRICKLEENQVV